MSIIYRRRNLHITQSQNDTLERWHEFSVAEHVRRALEQYIDRMKYAKDLEVADSPTKWKKKKTQK